MQYRHNWYKRKWIKALLTTIMVLLMVWIGKLVVVNTDTFNPLKVSLSQFHFSDIYFHWHRGHNADAAADMVLVDIQYLHDREEIATLLDSIAAHRPKVVALDVIFPPAVSLDPAADSHLTAAVSACPKVVLAQNAVPLPDGSWRLERSFFADGYTEGAVNMPASVVRYAEPLFDTLPTFAAQVATLATEHCTLNTAHLIDFGGAHQMTWTPGTEDFYLPALEGKLVFVGDLGDLRDYHNIPIGTGGQSRMSGTEVHALATAALLDNTAYREAKSGWSLLGQCVMLYLFILLLYIIPKDALGGLTGKILQVLFILIALPVCYILFLSCHLIISPTILIIGFGLSGLAMSIVNAIIKD